MLFEWQNTTTSSAGVSRIFFPILMWNTPEEASYLRTTVAGSQNCPHNVAQRGAKKQVMFVSISDKITGRRKCPGRSRWPCSLRRMSAAVCLLRLLVRIPSELGYLWCLDPFSQTRLRNTVLRSAMSCITMTETVLTLTDLPTYWWASTWS